MSSPTIATRRRTFRQLHETGLFLLPNPWDVGSALWLQRHGAVALATTSSGMAWSLGRPDGGVSRDEVLAHLRAIVDATDVPINADFERGFGADPDAVYESVRLAARTGVAGLSIEDSTGDPAAPQMPVEVAVERIRAARAALYAEEAEVTLVGRAESFLVGNPDIDDTIARLVAYADAGADCLYAPGIRRREDIAAVVAAVAPRPVNVLVGGGIGLSLRELEDLGVRRASIGGALARTAWTGFFRAAGALLERGSFDGFDGVMAYDAVDAAFK
jgi:2-methylisocitrate lyase-like PEP mutase family enzyme